MMHASPLLQPPTVLNGTAMPRGMQQVQHQQAPRTGGPVMHIRPPRQSASLQASRTSREQTARAAGLCRRPVSGAQQPLRCSSVQVAATHGVSAGSMRSSNKTLAHARGWGSGQRRGHGRGGPAAASGDDDFALQLSTSGAVIVLLHLLEPPR